MSFDAHEVFSFDSFFQQLLFWDDFEGDSVKDLWSSTGSAGGTSVVIDAQTGGIVRLSTNGDNDDSWRIDWGDVRSLLVSNNVAAEFRFKLTAATLVSARLSLFFDASNMISFIFDTDVDGNWHIETVDAGTPTDTDSGEAADTDYHVFRIETLDTPSVGFYIDDVLVGTHITNVPDDAADYLQPCILIQTREAATKTADIDYVYARQER